MTMAAAANPNVAAAAVPTQESSNGPLYVDTQHDDMVHDAQLDYYGCKLATSSSGNNLFDSRVCVAMHLMN